MKRQWRRRFVCGHSLYVSGNGAASAEWCDVCNAYVPVMVSLYEHAVETSGATDRIAALKREDTSPTIGTAA